MRSTTIDAPPLSTLVLPLARGRRLLAIRITKWRQRRFWDDLAERIRRPVASRTVLHAGCGPRGASPLPTLFESCGWQEVRLDIDPGAGPDVVASITDLAAVRPASVEAIWSSHVLEHLYQDEVPRALAEFLRVLTPGGFAVIRVPDLQEAARMVAADKAEATLYVAPIGPVTALDLLYGHRALVARSPAFMAHHTGFTAKTLGAALLRAGFDRVRIIRWAFELWAVAEKPAERQELAPSGWTRR